MIKNLIRKEIIMKTTRKVLVALLVLVAMMMSMTVIVAGAEGAAGESETPHVNSLAVGDTNKIVVTGDTLNGAGAPIEWVEFVVTEKAHYEFAGDTYAFIYNKMDLADFTACVCGFTGKADLEPGTYYICIGGVTAGEFNIAVTKTAIREQVAVGDNKVVVTGNTLNSAGAPIEWVEFVVTEKAHYEFAGDTYAFIYNKMDLADFTACVCGFTGKADLEPGTYYICVGGVVAGEFNITITKTAIEAGGDESGDPAPSLPQLQIGENTVTIDGSVTNLTGNAIAWYQLVVEEAGTYAIVSNDLNGYFYSKMDLTDFSACICGFKGVAELEPGTYYVCVGKDGKTGEFSVTIDNGGDVEVPATNTVVLGENQYVLNAPLFAIGYEFTTFTAAESGLYTFAGADPVTIFIWPDYPNVAVTDIPTTAPYVWNVKADNSGFEESVTVYLEAGVYAFGFRYDFAEVGEYTYTISYEPHEHEFVEGKCECGASDPDYTPPVEETPDDPAEEPELNFFEKIWQAILDFFKSIGSFFSNMFGGKE